MIEDSIYWIWLQLLFGIGTRRAELMMAYFDHPRDMYHGIKEHTQIAGMLLPEELTASDRAMQRAEELQRRTLKKGCSIITPDHPAYPPLLRSVYDRPAALYVSGDLDCLHNALTIAMVGTRKLTAYGREAAAHFAAGLAAAGAVVVSGLASGIDAESHRAALEAGGSTVGVLGCGIDVDYPKPNRALKTAMRAQGAVVTEFPLGTEPYAANFPLRNRILSGMSHGTLVVEADLQSGSLITARLALEQGRDLFAVPGPIFPQGQQGTHLLIKEGARLVDNIDDIVSQYSAYSAAEPPRAADGLQHGERLVDQIPAPSGTAVTAVPDASPPPEGMSDAATQLYAIIGRATMTVDDLADRGGLPIADALSAVTELELYGLLQSYPGRRFARL